MRGYTWPYRHLARLAGLPVTYVAMCSLIKIHGYVDVGMLGAVVTYIIDLGTVQEVDISGCILCLKDFCTLGVLPIKKVSLNDLEIDEDNCWRFIQQMLSMDSLKLVECGRISGISSATVLAYLTKKVAHKVIVTTAVVDSPLDDSDLWW